jgi:hypothetical protein
MLSVTFSTVMLIVIMQSVVMQSVVMLSVSFFYYYSECHYAEYRGAFQPTLLGNVSNYTRKVIYRYSPCEGSLKNLEDAKKTFFLFEKNQYVRKIFRKNLIYIPKIIGTLGNALAYSLLVPNELVYNGACKMHRFDEISVVSWGQSYKLF